MISLNKNLFKEELINNDINSSALFLIQDAM